MGRISAETPLGGSAESTTQAKARTAKEPGTFRRSEVPSVTAKEKDRKPGKG